MSNPFDDQLKRQQATERRKADVRRDAPTVLAGLVQGLGVEAAKLPGDQRDELVETAVDLAMRLAIRVEALGEDE